MTKIKYTDEVLSIAVRESFSWAEVCRRVGVKPMTGSQTHLKNRAVRAGMDHSHFLGQASNRGRTFGPVRDIQDYLSNEFPMKSHVLRKRLIKEGIKKEQCEVCGRTEWEGEEIPLELDHLNSDHFDNSIDNLQIVCPNCHAIKTSKQRAAPKSQRQGGTRRDPKRCVECGVIINHKATRCKKCVPKKSKIEWPKDEVLLAMLAESNFLQVGKRLGVSDNAVRKHLKLT